MGLDYNHELAEATGLKSFNIKAGKKSIEFSVMQSKTQVYRELFGAINSQTCRNQECVQTINAVSGSTMDSIYRIENYIHNLFK